MEATINSTNIKNYLEQSEGEALEFKSRLSSVHSICSVISAFANTKGGILIIGFHEGKGVIGVSDNESIIIKKAFSLLTNPPEYISYNVKIKNKQLLIIEVQKNTDSLTSFQGALLCRKGESNVHMSTADIKVFFTKDDDSIIPPKLVDILSEMNQINKQQTDEIAKLNDEITRQSKSSIKYNFLFCILSVILGYIITKLS